MRALITGGTSGIGYGVTKQLVALGWEVTIVGRNSQRGAEITSELGVSFIQADLSLIAETAQLAATIDAPLDALVLCAGIVFPPEAQQITDEGLEITFATNYLSRFALTELLLPKMATDGCIIMIGGNGNHNGVTTDWKTTAYGLASAQKAALAVDLYANHLAAHQPQLRIHTCYPGMVKTNLLKNAPLFFKLFVGLFGSSHAHGSMFVTRLIAEHHTAIHYHKATPMTFKPPLPNNNGLITYSQSFIQQHIKETSHAL